MYTIRGGAGVPNFKSVLDPTHRMARSDPIRSLFGLDEYTVLWAILPQSRKHLCYPEQN
jgi:hypothetical protein